MVLKNSFKLFLGQMYVWIHNYSSKRFQQCEWQRKILQTINFKNWTVNLSHGSVATFLFFFFFGFCLCFFLSSYFFPLACFRLFSLLPLLASRDFWDNVFLVDITYITYMHGFSGSCTPKGVLFHFGFITNQRIYTVRNISFDLHFDQS